MFALFAGETYYPREGFYDFVCKSDSIEYLVGIVEKLKERDTVFHSNIEWWQIVDLRSCKIIKGG